jgi:hypothetical protein
MQSYRSGVRDKLKHTCRRADAVKVTRHGVNAE